MANFSSLASIAANGGNVHIDFYSTICLMATIIQNISTGAQTGLVADSMVLKSLKIVNLLLKSYYSHKKTEKYIRNIIHKNVMFLNQMRQKSFWILDSLKGRAIKNQLKEIEFSLDNPNSDRAIKLKTYYMERLFKHASETTDFYYSYKDAKQLSDFPIIKKTTIQNNFENFQSTEFKNKKNYKVSTSGSTGVPFFLFQNQGKRHRNHADAIYFFSQSGFQIGQRLYELEVWRNHNKKNKLKSWLQNVVQFDISRLPDSQIETLLSLLKSDNQSKKTLLGFASAYEMISRYLEKNNIFFKDLNITSAIANSEYLNYYTKTTLAKHLNTTVLSRYSSEEIGIIAQQTLQSPDSFVLNHASYCIEILDFDTDIPVKPGAYGRIVVTDLFNYAMPIIRYDTGDVAKLGVNNDGVTYLEQIEGRKMDLIYDTKGNIVSSFVVYTKFFNYYTLLKQYQFIQQGEKEYEVKLNVHNVFPFEKELAESIKKDFGSDAKVIITYVDEIPPLASGKRKKVVNNYKVS